MRGLLPNLRLVLAELGRPGAQRDNWFAWAAGQTAHAMIGAVLAGAMLFFLPAIWAFLAAALGYAVVKEVPDYLRAPGWAGARDSVQDALFVTAGAALAVALWGAHDRLFLVAVSAAVVGLGIGIYGRIRQ
jgi:hypothetical protein